MSARIRFASGLLYRLSFHIHPCGKDLNWLFENQTSVLTIARMHKQVSKIEAFKHVAMAKDGSSLQEFCTSYPQEAVKFFEFILDVKKALRAWNLHLQQKHVSIKDINNLFMFFLEINEIASCLHISELCMTEAEVKSTKEELLSVAANLELVLVRHIPALSGTKWLATCIQLIHALFISFLAVVT